MDWIIIESDAGMDVDMLTDSFLYNKKCLLCVTNKDLLVLNNLCVTNKDV